MNLETLKYPIGHPNIPENITKKNIKEWIFILENLHQNLELLTRELSTKQLSHSMQGKQLSIRQVVHHCYEQST